MGLRNITRHYGGSMNRKRTQRSGTRMRTRFSARYFEYEYAYEYDWGKVMTA
jgi:hypothetical protein